MEHSLMHTTLSPEATANTGQIPPQWVKDAWALRFEIRKTLESIAASDYSDLPRQERLRILSIADDYLVKAIAYVSRCISHPNLTPAQYDWVMNEMIGIQAAHHEATCQLVRPNDFGTIIVD